jgi:hypothetical protein
MEDRKEKPYVGSEFINQSACRLSQSMPQPIGRKQPPPTYEPMKRPTRQIPTFCMSHLHCRGSKRDEGEECEMQPILLIASPR